MNTQKIYHDPTLSWIISNDVLCMMTLVRGMGGEFLKYSSIYPTYTIFPYRSRFNGVVFIGTVSCVLCFVLLGADMHSKRLNSIYTMHMTF